MEKKSIKLFILSLLIVFAAGVQEGFAQQKRKFGDPLDNLPKNIEQLTYFGERADISPDNKSIAFMTKNFGDAMVIDLQSRIIKCLTCNIPAAAFLRVMHLPNGDFILMGPDHFEDVKISRLRDSELWYLKNEQGAKPIKMGQKVSEGFALSKKNMKIVYTEIKQNVTGSVLRELILADVDISGSVPKLINKKAVYESSEQGCIIEAQDFYNDDKGLIFFCYVTNGITATMGLDLRSGKVSNLTNDPKLHTEPEGVFPDGKFIAVESDRHVEWMGGVPGSANIDIWKFKLDGTGAKEMVRLTNFNDYEGSKAANPVVSANGKFMAFQSAKSNDPPPGIGYGILIYWFDK
ncbi:MAG: WD40-like beta Propeller containing protein [Segetibacter sp.]|nr:WD40-like beta Propeller containing protein [Segetibacter sp.]